MSLTDDRHDPPVLSVEIGDVFPDAVKRPAGEITVGCHTFDVMGGRQRVTRVWKGKATISIGHRGNAYASVTWETAELVTCVPAVPVSA